MWILERIALVIQGLTGVALSTPSTWRLLRGRLGWTVQRPTRQAKERDEQAIQHWVAPMSGPGSKGGPRGIGLGRRLRRIGRLADPTGAPHLVPAGRTPILGHWFGWKKASMAAALGDHPSGQGARLCFHLQQPSDTTDTLIAVLEQLAGFYAGQRVVLSWDGLSAHWSTRVRAWLDCQRDWLTVERFPASAPSSTRPSSCGPTSRPGAGESASHQPGRGRRRHRTRHPTGRQGPGPVVGFLAHTGLSLDP